MSLHTKTLAQLAAGLHARDFSSVELTRELLARIETHQPVLNALISVTATSAMQEAAAADGVLARGGGGPLTGIPLVHKDIFCTEGVRTTCASRMLDNFVAPYDATVVAKLKAEGMVMLGKANIDRKSTRLNSSHLARSRMPSSA